MGMLRWKTSENKWNRLKPALEKYSKEKNIDWICSLKESHNVPWLVWLSGLRANLWTKESLVRFPVRAHAWVVRQVPGGGACEMQSLMFLSLSFSFSLKINKIFKKNKKEITQCNEKSINRVINRFDILKIYYYIGIRKKIDLEMKFEEELEIEEENRPNGVK